MATSVRRRAKPKKRKAKKLTPTVKGLVPKGSEEKSGCLWCPLFVWSEDFDEHATQFQRKASQFTSKEPDGHTVLHRCVSEPWNEVDILFVGEAPNRDEDKQGVPFAGGPGGLLKKTIKHGTTLDPERVGFTNLVSCRPPRNRKTNKTEIQSCSPKLLREIATRKPKVIVAMGNGPLEFLAGQSGITTFCGRVLSSVREEFPDVPVVACLHPAYILRQDHEIDRFVEAIQLAEKVMRGDYEEMQGEGEYHTLTNLDEIEALFDRFQEEAEPTAFDTETGGLSPFQEEFDKLLCFSFSNKEGEGYTIPFDHKESPFRRQGRKRRRLVEMLRKFFKSPLQKIAQNEKYDRNHIREAIGVQPVNVEDTLLIHFTIDERQGTHGLKQLAYSYTGMGGYEQPLELYQEEHKEANPNLGGSYANIPGDVLFRYAAMDADVTVRVRNGLWREQELTGNDRLRVLAEHFYPELSRTLGEVEFEGAQIDPEMVRFLDKRYTREMARLQKKIQKDPMVAQFCEDRTENDSKKFPEGTEFNPESTQQLGKVMFGYYGLRPRELTESGFSKLKARLEKWLIDHSKKVFKTQALKKKNAPHWGQVVESAIQNKEWEFFTTKADVLHDFEREGNPLAELILEHRGYSTLHGTFIKPLLVKLDANERIHGTFQPHGTVTARLSSKDPNLQNIPNKGGGLVKRCYVSRFGDDGVLLQADYSQVELRVAACYFNEPTMVQAYRDGADLHTLTAAAIAKLPMERYKKLPAEEQKAWRTRAKRVNFGVLYGGGPPALVNTLRKDGVFITVDEAKELIEAYFDARPALKAGMEKLERDVCKKGYLEAFTGHRRRIPEVFSKDEKLVARALRQSVNFPIQCSAAQMTNMSMILVNRELKKRKLRSRLVLTVHDSLVFDCHVDEVVEVGQIAKNIMETLPERSEEVLPGLDWSWLTVPIVADLEIGFDWGTLVPLSEAKLDGEERELDIDDLDVDYLWAAMEEKVAA